MSYEDVKQIVKNFGSTLPANGTDEDGNVVIVSEGKDECGHFYEVQTAQENGWIRVNVFYEDGTVTETFTK